MTSVVNNILVLYILMDCNCGLCVTYDCQYYVIYLTGILFKWIKLDFVDLSYTRCKHWKNNYNEKCK